MQDLFEQNHIMISIMTGRGLNFGFLVKYNRDISTKPNLSHIKNLFSLPKNHIAIYVTYNNIYKHSKVVFEADGTLRVKRGRTDFWCDGFCCKRYWFDLRLMGWTKRVRHDTQSFLVCEIIYTVWCVLWSFWFDRHSNWKWIVFVVI